MSGHDDEPGVPSGEDTGVASRSVAAIAERDRAAGGKRGHGQLRIYLGAAAGVGKTYAMLGEGHRRAERGADVVVGFAETHGRPQTAALLDGLGALPGRRRR